MLRMHIQTMTDTDIVMEGIVIVTIIITVTITITTAVRKAGADLCAR
jgi:hypothetical protein